VDTAHWYRHFTTQEARGSSPCYEEWATGMAGDPEVLAYPDGSLPERRNSTSPVFIVALDGTPIAYAGEHGQWLDWFALPPAPGDATG
jgi:hypothetical protein